MKLFSALSLCVTITLGAALVESSYQGSGLAQIPHHKKHQNAGKRNEQDVDTLKLFTGPTDDWKQFADNADLFRDTAEVARKLMTADQYSKLAENELDKKVHGCLSHLLKQHKPTDTGFVFGPSAQNPLWNMCRDIIKKRCKNGSPIKLLPEHAQGFFENDTLFQYLIHEGLIAGIDYYVNPITNEPISLIQKAIQNQEYDVMFFLAEHAQRDSPYDIPRDVLDQAMELLLSQVICVEYIGIAASAVNNLLKLGASVVEPNFLAYLLVSSCTCNHLVLNQIMLHSDYDSKQQVFEKTISQWATESNYKSFCHPSLHKN